jgi:flagellin-like hook-associated protein FlgL
VSAQNAQANLNTTNIGLQRTTRLSGGFRINQAGDDAAGLAVANSPVGTGGSQPGHS